LRKNKQREALAAYGFILPTFIGYVAFVIGPIIAAVWLSFTEYDIFSPAEPVGLRNYADLLKDTRLRTVYRNTLYFTVAATSLNLSVGVMLALLVNRRMPGFVSYIYRLAYFFPVLIALVFSAVIWDILYSKDTGIINYYLNFLGIQDIAWLGDKRTAMPAIIVMDVWKNTGFAMIIILAGLQGIPSTYYEAARVDGANGLQTFWHITLPLLTPSIFFLIIIFGIGALQVFDSIIVLTAGGPGDTTRSAVMYIYEHAFQLFRLGYASSVAMTLFVVISAVTLLQFRFGQRWVQY
jgi:multiple sugar transport system permease protein